MIQAYVLIEAEPARVPDLLKEMPHMELDGSIITRVHAVTGRYDLIAFVESPDLQQLGRWITEGIANAVGVRRTETCLVVWWAMPPQIWKTVSTREVYRNNWMRLREDIAEMPNGKTTIYGVCEFGQCVGVLPFIDRDHVMMVRQYRYPAQENHRWEMPTGGVHPDETPEQAAQRELMEEAGYRAGELIWVSSYHTSKSVCVETAHLYIGHDLVAEEAMPDDTEFFEHAVMPFDQVLHLVSNSEIRDSMTVIAVLHAARLKQTGRF